MEGKEDWVSSKIEMRDSEVHGTGLFATSIMEKGEVLMEWYSGYTDKKTAMKAKEEGRLTMQWDDDVFSVHQDVRDEKTYINHSCDPNCWMVGVHTVKARRRIEPGEELTIDYGTMLFEENDGSIMECNCGSPECRKKITIYDWKDPAIQERYKGHFIPIIEKMIITR